MDVKLVIKTWVVAHKILETAQSPNSSFPFLFDFGLGLGDLDSGLSILMYDIRRLVLILHLLKVKKNS